MDTLNKRLVLLREQSAGKRGQRVFARMVGIKQQSISNYERGSIPSANVLAKIVLATGVSAEWLLTGRGPMFSEDRQGTTAANVTFGLRLFDDNDKEVELDRLGDLMGISDEEAKRFLKELTETPAGRNRVPMTIRRPDGQLMTLHARYDTTKLLERVKVDITDTEVQLTVPELLLKQRMIRVIPESQA